MDTGTEGERELGGVTPEDVGVDDVAERKPIH